jgi:hypothetical protein
VPHNHILAATFEADKTFREYDDKVEVDINHAETRRGKSAGYDFGNRRLGGGSGSGRFGACDVQPAIDHSFVQYSSH